MTGFDERKTAFENKFALDEALLFKAEARCCKLFGLWLAEKMGLNDSEANAYASKIVGANLEEPGFDDVKRAVEGDILAHNLDISEEEIDAKLAELFIKAQEEVKNEA
jgi:hypothetical protein